MLSGLIKKRQKHPAKYKPHDIDLINTYGPEVYLYSKGIDLIKVESHDLSALYTLGKNGLKETVRLSYFATRDSLSTITLIDAVDKLHQRIRDAEKHLDTASDAKAIIKCRLDDLKKKQ